MAADELTIPFDDDCIPEINTENLIDLEDKTVELEAHQLFTVTKRRHFFMGIGSS